MSDIAAPDSESARQSRCAERLDWHLIYQSGLDVQQHFASRHVQDLSRRALRVVAACAVLAISGPGAFAQKGAAAPTEADPTRGEVAKQMSGAGLIPVQSNPELIARSIAAEGTKRTLAKNIGLKLD